MAGCGSESLRCFLGSVWGSFCMLTPAPGHPAGGNRITQAVLGAHDGGVFGLCALRDGTLVSGGGRDRRVVLWGSDYSKLQEVEVRRGRGSYKGEGISHHPPRAPNTRPCSPSLSPPSPPCPHVCCCCSVPKLHPTLCDPMDCSMPGLSVRHYLLELPKFMSIESLVLSSHLTPHLYMCPKLICPPLPPHPGP